MPAQVYTPDPQIVQRLYAGAAGDDQDAKYTDPRTAYPTLPPSALTLPPPDAHDRGTEAIS